MSPVFIDSNAIIKYFVGDTLAKKLLEPIIYGDTIGY
jgi:predicted nucleic acid-binding protein